MIISSLNPKMGYTKRENSLTASLLYTYFDANFLITLGWTEAHGKLIIIVLSLFNIFLFLGRIGLNNMAGHMSLFSEVLKIACPDQLANTSQLNASFSLVMKRIREKNKRKSVQMTDNVSVFLFLLDSF